MKAQLSASCALALTIIACGVPEPLAVPEVHDEEPVANADPGESGTTVRLKPAKDIDWAEVSGVGESSSSDFYKNIDDGFTLASSDDSASYVRSRSDAAVAHHTVGFAGAPAGEVTEAVIRYRVRRTRPIEGFVQVELYDGDTHVATGPKQLVPEDWSDLDVTFSGLDIASGNALRVKLVYFNSSNGAVRCSTMVVEYLLPGSDPSAHEPGAGAETSHPEADAGSGSSDPVADAGFGHSNPTSDAGTSTGPGDVDAGTNDKFGVRKIYPTKPGGREWFVNMNNPTDDPLYVPRSGAKFTKQPDGSWQPSGSTSSSGITRMVRYEIGTGAGQAQWRDVEMTGYIYTVSVDSGLPSWAGGDPGKIPFQWYARGARHSTSVPCEGTSLKGRLRINGVSEVKKEISHTGGYTGERGGKQATSKSLMNRWVGFKVIMFNIPAGVRVETWVDDQANNGWTKVSDVTDTGGWNVLSQSKFDSDDCGRPNDYIVSNGGPMAAFRSDYTVWNFKNLSIREIQAP